MICCKKNEFSWDTRWHSWLRHRATSLKATGWIPDGVTGSFHWPKASCSIMALRSTWRLTEMSTRTDKLATFRARFLKNSGLLNLINTLRASPEPRRESFVYFLAVNRDGCGRKHSVYIRRDSGLPARHRISKRVQQGRRLRVASGATAPVPALEGAPRFRPMSLSSYILR